MCAALFALLLCGGCRTCVWCGAPKDWEARIAAASPDSATRPVKTEVLNGTVSCMERVTILPTFEITVRLRDLAKKDDAAVAEWKTDAFKSFPVKFSMPYNAALINDKSAYGVSAELTSQGVVLFATDTVYSISPSENNPEPDLVLMRVRE